MLRFLTAGESHGRALVVVVEGLPAGLPVAEEQIAAELARRRLGYGRGPRMRFERDELTIVGGVRHGRTLGSPVAIEIANTEWDRDPDKWQKEMSPRAEDGPTQKPLTQPRPGHADLAGMQKYGFGDARDVLERASARETAARVAAGALAKALLARLGITVVSHVIQIGAARTKSAERPGPADLDRVDASEVRCLDPVAEQEMVEEIKAAAKDGDSLGGVVEVLAYGVPVGLGSHVHWDRKLDGRIAQAICSINAFKGVEFGAGFDGAARRGSQVHDVILPADKWTTHPWAHATNNAGGIEGGMSTGEPIIVRAAVKPIPTLAHPLPSVDLDTGEEVRAHYERSDVCVVPAAGVVAEAMVALVLADAWLEKFGGDTVEEIRANVAHYLSTIGPRARRNQ